MTLNFDLSFEPAYGEPVTLLSGRCTGDREKP